MFGKESLPDVYAEMEPLARAHYAEMSARLATDGIFVSPYKPRLDEYFRASNGGWLKTFTVRRSGALVGYANVYVTNDMHNGDLIAQEDVLYVTPSHRNGAGRALVKFGIAELRKLGVLRLYVSAVTDLRVAKLWKRMGFKDVATQMIFTPQG